MKNTEHAGCVPFCGSMDVNLDATYFARDICPLGVNEARRKGCC